MARERKIPRTLHREPTDTNLFEVISMIKLQSMPSSAKAKFWRRRAGSSRVSLMSDQSQNFRMVVEVLLEKSSSHHIHEAVLQAISAGHVQIAETILKHKRYLELWKDRKKLGDDDNFFKTQFEESQFSPDITPLILAAQKNQYEIVQLLLLRGEKIQKPHKFGCQCRECVNKMKFDKLRSAKYRLNAYRGMASEAYISLSSKDPILTAFQLSKELKNLSRVEKCFKQEYKELKNQLSEYVVKLLDRVRNQEELELVLNKAGKPNDETYHPLARLNLALTYMEKKFVAHPSCQQRLDNSWYEGIGPFLKAGILMRVLMILLFILTYPFVTVIYIFAPNVKLKCIRILGFPWVKFVVHSMSFITFLLMIVISTAEASYVLRETSTLASDYPAIHEKYTLVLNTTRNFMIGADMPIRPLFPTTIQFLLPCWVLGFLYHECTQVYHEGASTYCSSLYNIMDYALLLVYTCSFTLRYLVMFKVHLALNYLSTSETGQLISNSVDTFYNLYWITADRYYWEAWDPINLSEGLFAIGNILSFARISYLLPANEALGPLQISLGRMIKDILKCMCLILGVLVAFVIGLQNLYWYYNVRESIELEERSFDVPAQEFFGNSIKTFRTCFWSVFGRGESSVVRLNEYQNHVTEDIGYVIYGSYNVIMVTVLMNMLIAMMARSFQAITEDSDIEWKFARSKLYMEYIKDEQILPVPLNLVRIPRAMLEWVFSCCEKEGKEEREGRAENGHGPNDLHGHSNMAFSQNGMEPIQHVTQMGSRELDQCHSVDLSGVDIHDVSNGSGTSTPRYRSRRQVHRTSIPGLVDGTKSYQRVMQRIIQRYIFDIQREAEVTEDDFEEIKQDISSFRYEMLSVMKNREQQLADLQSAFVRTDSMSTGLTAESDKADIIQNKLQSKLTERLHDGSVKRDNDRVFRSSASWPSASETNAMANTGEKGQMRKHGSTDSVIVEAKSDDDEECYIIDN